MLILDDYKEVFIKILKLENKLTEYYNIIEHLVKDEKCREIIAFLKERHINNLKYIRDIRVEDYGKDSWIRSAPDCFVKVVLPINEITSESSIEEIINHILDFEKKMKEIYSCISDEICSGNEKELFNSLAEFKGRQIYEIKSCLEV